MDLKKFLGVDVGTGMVDMEDLEEVVAWMNVLSCGVNISSDVNRARFV